jgi:hypothetical protein
VTVFIVAFLLLLGPVGAMMAEAISAAFDEAYRMDDTLVILFARRIKHFGE